MAAPLPPFGRVLGPRPADKKRSAWLGVGMAIAAKKATKATYKA
jgi:hypothetical protein